MFIKFNPYRVPSQTTRTPRAIEIRQQMNIEKAPRKKAMGYEEAVGRTTGNMT
jgi:hypothetical protein